MSVLVVSKIIRRCTIISVITLFCMGFITETEAMRSLFCCCCCRDPSPEPSATFSEMRKLRYGTEGLREGCKSMDIQNEGAAIYSSNPEKAYELFRIAFGGDGKSEFSKKFRSLFYDGIKGFCKNDNLFEGDYKEIRAKFVKQTAYLWPYIDLAFINNCYSLFVTVKKLSFLQEKAENKEKAISLMKEALFWCILNEKQEDPVEDSELFDNIRLLKAMEGIKWYPFLGCSYEDIVQWQLKQMEQE